MDRTVTVGVVGCGAFCAGTHIPNIMANPGFKLKWFCDRDKARLLSLKADYPQTRITENAEEIFSDSDVDAVICATKPDVRLPIMQMAVKYRKHLFVEKPLCYDNSQIATMVKLMRNAPIRFMVGFNRPYSPLMQEVKPLFRKHKRGNVLISYRIVGEYQIWPEHHRKAVLERGESTIIHEVTHVFDLLNWLTDLEPVSVYTIGGGNVDNIITLRYPHHIAAVIVAGDNASAAYPKERLEIDTNCGVLIGEEFIELKTAGIPGAEPVRTFDYWQESERLNTRFHEAAERYRIWRESVTAEELAYGYYYDRQVRPDKGHYGELEHFRLAIVEDRPPDTGIERGAMANLIADAALRSWREERPVSVDYSILQA